MGTYIFTVKTLVKPCTRTTLYPEWYKSGIFTGLGTKLEELFFQKSRKILKFEGFMPIYGQI